MCRRPVVALMDDQSDECVSRGTACQGWKKAKMVDGDEAKINHKGPKEHKAMS